MAPRTFPAEPRFESPAEADVWDALRRGTPDDGALFANLRFTDRHGDCEADVVVAIPDAGIAVIEVKGGVVTHDSQHFLQRGSDMPPRRIDPVDQALRSKYALREFLRRHPAWRGGDVRMVHLVVLPYSRVPEDFHAPDCPRWMVVDQGQVGNVSRLAWDALHGLETDSPPMTASDVDVFVDCLTGRMLPQRDLAQEVVANERLCDFLTEKQASVLDHISLLRRVEVRGAAGSGKTWLAVEQARRLARSGQRVGLLCYSRGLSRYLRRRVEQLPPRERPAYVGTFHALGVGWGASGGRIDDSEYFEHRLPEMMTALARHLGPSDRFDAFVVDEAQDFADTWWQPLVAGLRDGASGGLYVFADEGQRVFARQGRPPVELAPIQLVENLRNTKRIAQTFGSLTPTQMRYRGGEGVPVKFVQCAAEEAIGTADDEAVALLDQEWPPEHVALLTTGHRHPEQVARQAAGADAYWDSYWSGEDVFYGHVLGFKGLERPAVILAVDGFRDESRAREMLYVGLSRARDHLVVCGDIEMIRRVGGEGVVRRLTAAR